MQFDDLHIKDKSGLIPAIILDYITGNVLMLGYMNESAFNQTLETGNVTFYSRSKQRLWMKGESSGNVLILISITEDCDQDTLLIRAKPTGPTCHKGIQSCFGKIPFNFMEELENVIQTRFDDTTNPNSYVQKMKQKGLDKIAQKVGEEAVELVIEAKNSDQAAFLNESADLFFHFLLLLKMKGYTFEQVLDILEQRHRTA